jgi:hypothetical protein
LAAQPFLRYDLLGAQAAVALQFAASHRRLLGG